MSTDDIVLINHTTQNVNDSFINFDNKINKEELNVTLVFKPYIICDYNSKNNVCGINKYIDVFDYHMYIENQYIDINQVIKNILKPLEIIEDPRISKPNLLIYCNVEINKKFIDDHLETPTYYKNLYHYIYDYMIETYGDSSSHPKIPDFRDKAYRTWMLTNNYLDISEKNGEKFIIKLGLCFFDCLIKH